MTNNPSAERLAANQRLHVAIADLLDQGLDVPCVGPASDYWVSDDIEDLVVASRACRSCPALASCRRYTDAHPETFGVWAGRIHSRDRVLTGVQIQHRRNTNRKDENMNDDNIPADIVPRQGLTAEALRKLNSAVREPTEVSEPGKLREDVDGDPLGVTEGHTTHAPLGAVVVTASELEAAGLTPEDVPNLRVI